MMRLHFTDEIKINIIQRIFLHPQIERVDEIEVANEMNRATRNKIENRKWIEIVYTKVIR